jgi:hypothetical protein
LGRGRTDAQERVERGYPRKKFGRRDRTLPTEAVRASFPSRQAYHGAGNRLAPTAHFSEGGKTAYCNAALMQFALSAVIFGLRRDEGRPLPALPRGFDHASGGSNKGLCKEKKSGFDNRLIGDSYDNRNHVIEGKQRTFIEVTNDLAAFVAHDGNDFIDHDLRGHFQAVRLARLDREPVDWRIG